MLAMKVVGTNMISHWVEYVVMREKKNFVWLQVF